MTVTNYLWDEDSYLDEYDELGTTTVAYTNEPTEFGSAISQRRSTETSFYHYDAQGSTTELSDSSESVTDSYLFNSWGDLVSSTGITTNPFRWIGNVGYYWEEETHSYYVRARIYQPMIGRWVSRDPLGFVDGFNLYVYVLNNPTAHSDPSGLGINCAFTMQDIGGKENTDWEKSGNQIPGGVTKSQICNNSEILTSLSANKCCTISLLGHRGGPGNPGGIVSYCKGKKNKIFPDLSFQAKLKEYFDKNCPCSCQINIFACGEKKEKVRIALQVIANTTGCRVCGAIETLMIGSTHHFCGDTTALFEAMRCVRPFWK